MLRARSSLLSRVSSDHRWLLNFPFESVARYVYYRLVKKPLTESVSLPGGGRALGQLWQVKEDSELWTAVANASWLNSPSTPPSVAFNTAVRYPLSDIQPANEVEQLCNFLHTGMSVASAKQLAWPIKLLSRRRQKKWLLFYEVRELLPTKSNHLRIAEQARPQATSLL